VIQRGFFQEIRNRTFYSISDLNHLFRDYLNRLNNEVMKDYGVSRAQRFEEEKKFLKELPGSRFQLSEWRSAKVHPDCHIQVGKNFYSTPFRSSPHKTHEAIRKAVWDVAKKNKLDDFKEIPVSFVQSGAEVLYNGDSVPMENF